MKLKQTGSAAGNFDWLGITYGLPVLDDGSIKSSLNLLGRYKLPTIVVLFLIFKKENPTVRRASVHLMLDSEIDN